MLRVLGSPKRLCDGVSRRDLLQAGGISLLGLGLGELAEATDRPSPPAPLPRGERGGSAKHVILLFL